MEAAKADAFLKKMSKDSLNNEILWERMIDLENIKPDSNPQLANLLFQSEFRQIDLYASYFAAIGDGTVFIINETDESGRDGTVISGYNAYILRDESDKIYRIPCSQSSIYQLLNSIRVYLSENENEIEEFIDSYLKDDH